MATVTALCLVYRNKTEIGDTASSPGQASMWLQLLLAGSLQLVEFSSGDGVSKRCGVGTPTTSYQTHTKVLKTMTLLNEKLGAAGEQVQCVLYT